MDYGENYPSQYYIQEPVIRPHYARYLMYAMLVLGIAYIIGKS